MLYPAPALMHVRKVSANDAIWLVSREGIDLHYINCDQNTAVHYL